VVNPAFLVLAVTFVLVLVWLVVEKWLERRNSSNLAADSPPAASAWRTAPPLRQALSSEGDDSTPYVRRW
jgi:hypothetical protein